MRIVEREGRTRRRSHAETFHQWLRAMVTCTQRDTFAVENCCHVVRMHAFGFEREYCAFAACLTNDTGPVEPADFDRCMLEEATLVLCNCGAIERGQPVKRGSKTDSLDDRRRAGFETRGRLRVTDVPARNFRNHFA